MGIALTVIAILTVVLATVVVALTVRLNSLKAAIDTAIDRLAVERSGRSRTTALVTGAGAAADSNAAARAQLAGLRATLDTANLGVMIIGDQAGIMYANPPARRFLGARRGDAVAEVRIRELASRVLEEGRPAVQELDLYTPSRRIIRLAAVPLSGAPMTARVAVYIEDLTERRRVEAVRRDFVANVGHELKTPLGALAVLAEAMTDVEDPAVRSKLEQRMAAEARRMARLVDDILDLSMVEAARVSKMPVSVAAVVSAAVAQNRLAADELGIGVVIEAVDPDLRVLGDQRQLVSAVANLVDNAVKYTAIDPGRRGQKVAVRVTAEDDKVVIEVEDGGIGIPAAHLDRIFERFYRVDRGRSRATGGTGLGLSIVRNVALNHGGRVTVASDEGFGSTFRLILPRLVA